MQQEQELAEDSSMLDALSSGGSAIDSTLAEIQSLKIIEQELKKAEKEGKKDSIDQSLIEDSTVTKLKHEGGKDVSRIESLVNA